MKNHFENFSKAENMVTIRICLMASLLFASTAAADVRAPPFPLSQPLDLRQHCERAGEGGSADSMSPSCGWAWLILNADFRSVGPAVGSQGGAAPCHQRTTAEGSLSLSLSLENTVLPCTLFAPERLRINLTSGCVEQSGHDTPPPPRRIS